MAGSQSITADMLTRVAQSKRTDSKNRGSCHNTRKLDAIRQEIETLNLDPVDKAVALTSLILALDRVDSSLGHFSAYLKTWAPRAYKELMLEVPEVFTSEGDHEVYQTDIFELVRRVSVDLAYFDPPYGSNNEKMPASRVRYAAYYHLWKSVILFDKPALFGKAKRREDTSDPLAASVFEEFRRNDDGRFIAVEAIARLIQETQHAGFCYPTVPGVAQPPSSSTKSCKTMENSLLHLSSTIKRTSWQV